MSPKKRTTSSASTSKSPKSSKSQTPPKPDSQPPQLPSDLQTTSESTPNASNGHPAFIVDTIFPRQELHLIGGPAQAGKTSMLYEIASNLENHRNVFGYAAYPVPFCMISCVHSMSACQVVMERVECQFPIYSFVDCGFEGENESNGKTDKIDQVIAASESLVDGLQLIFLDGIIALYDGSITDNSAVGRFLRLLVRKLQSRGLTMIATGRSAKPKDASNGIRPIDRFLGATAWTELSSTFSSIEQAPGTTSLDPRRRIMIMPKQSQPSYHDYRFSNEGRLIEVVPSDGLPERIETLAQVLSVRGEGSKISTIEMYEIGDDLGIPLSTMKRYLGVLLKQGRLKDGGHGWYEIPRVQ